MSLFSKFNKKIDLNPDETQWATGYKSAVYADHSPAPEEPALDDQSSLGEQLDSDEPQSSVSEQIGATDDPLLSCLQLVARHFDRPTSRDTLTAGLPLEEGRLTSALMFRSAERIGLEATLVRQLKDPYSIELPAIMYTDEGWPVVVMKELPRRSFEIFSCDGVRKEIKASQITRRLGEECISFSQIAQTYDPSWSDPSAANIKNRHWFWGVVSGYWRSYARIALGASMINLFALASPFFVMNVYDRVLPNKATSTLLVLAVGLGLVILFDLILKTARAFLIDNVGRKIDLRLSSKLFEKVLNAPLSSRPASTGAFSNRVSQYEFVREFFTSSTLALFIDMAFIFLFLIVIWQLSGIIVLVPLVAVVGVLMAGFVLQLLIGRHLDLAQAEAAQRQGVLIEAISTVETVKSLRAEGQLLKKWDAFSRASSHTSEKIKRLSSIGVNFTQFLQQFVTVGIVVFGAFQFASGDMSTGAIIATVMLASRTVGPLSQVAITLSRARQAALSIKILDEIMHMPDDRVATKSFVERDIEEGRIDFRNVRFQYPEVERFVLDGVSFSVKPGEKVGIVGRIGSGKTTIARLITGLYYPSEGEVLIDGIDIRQYHPYVLRRQIGLVVQEADLFQGGIKENILMADPLASDDRLLEAAKISGVDEFVSQHPMGYDMPVGERGNLLSGGQRQSVSLARMLLANPKILFLDEPTSSMDMQSERNLITHIKSMLRPDQTVLIATHRNSLLTLVDRLMVVDRGKVIADGPKDKVLAQLQAVQQGGPSGRNPTPVKVVPPDTASGPQ